MKNFAQLFAGGTESHTVLRYVPGSNQDGSKLEASVETMHAEPTAELYDAHTAGKRSIGIVPIRRDGTVSFVVLDVDVYGRDQSIETAKRVHRVRGCPFIPCLSKSDGLHLFAFYEKPVQAKVARGMAQEWIKKLNVKAEIFPKQEKLVGDMLGNAINLPYFGEFRPAIDMDGNPYSLPEFLELADTLLIRQVAEKKERTAPQSPLETGPVCLESRINEGIIDDNRANWLYQTAIFLFKKYGDVETMGQYLYTYNTQYFHRPEEQIDQIAQLKKSVAKKPTLGYKCSPDWAAERCNQQTCMKRKHGIRGNGSIGFTDQEAEITEVLELYKTTGAPQYVVKIYDKGVFFENLEEVTNVTKFINAVFIVTGKNLEWEGKAKDFGPWMRKQIAEKGVVDERSDNEYLSLQGIVLAKFKGWVKSRINQKHESQVEAYVMQRGGKIWAPVVEFMEQIDKMKVALGERYNRKHINTVLFDFGCTIEVNEDNGERYYVCDPWFEMEDKRVQNQPYS